MAYNFSQEEYEFDDDCDFDATAFPTDKCDVSQAIIDGVARQPVDQVVGQ